MAAGTIIVAGSAAQRPGYGGHAWVFLQYLLGFKDLGYEVVFVDRLEPEMCIYANGSSPDPERSINARYLAETMRSFDLDSAWALMCDGGSRCLGLSRRELLSRVERSTLLLNVNGFLNDEEVLDRASLRVFLDIDPGFLQMWSELGLHDSFQGHDVYVTIGESIGSPECAIPTCGLDWITTRHPVVLDRWPVRENGGASFTSVGTWRGPYDPIEYDGKVYGLRVHEFRKLMRLPQLSETPFELALDIHPSESKDLAALRAGGWSLADPKAVACDPAVYQRYVQDSKAELMVAKGMYVQTRSGWFSDRSICYLASGRPVLAHDTGFTCVPAGEGVVPFTTIDDAVAGADEISRDYGRHARAARSIAEEHFDSRKVLGHLVERLGVA